MFAGVTSRRAELERFVLISSRVVSCRIGSVVLDVESMLASRASEKVGRPSVLSLGGGGGFCKSCVAPGAHGPSGWDTSRPRCEGETKTTVADWRGQQRRRRQHNTTQRAAAQMIFVGSAGEATGQRRRRGARGVQGPAEANARRRSRGEARLHRTKKPTARALDGRTRGCGAFARSFVGLLFSFGEIAGVDGSPHNPHSRSQGCLAVHLFLALRGFHPPSTAPSPSALIAGDNATIFIKSTIALGRAGGTLWLASSSINLLLYSVHHLQILRPPTVRRRTRVSLRNDTPSVRARPSRQEHTSGGSCTLAIR